MISRRPGKEFGSETSLCSKTEAVGPRHYLGSLFRAVQNSWSRNVALHHIKGLSVLGCPVLATFKSLDILQIEFLYENDAFQLTDVSAAVMGLEK